MATLKVSTVYTRMFKMIDSADHFSLKTGLTCVVNLSKAGAAFGAAAGTITEVANGWYKVALTTADTGTLGDLAYYITATGADDTDFVDQVTTNILGDTLPANVTTWNGTTVATPDTAGYPKVTIKSGTGTGEVSLAAGLVTAGTVSDKTGYALTAAYDLAKTAAQTGDIMKLSSGTGANQISLASGLVTVGTNNDKTGYTASTVSDKTGYSLSGTQTFNVTGNITGNLSGSVGSVTGNVGGSVASVTAGVTVTTNSDKTGYSLAASQLFIKKNTALANFMFLMLDVTDHVTPKTGLTVTGTVSIDGAAFGSLTNAVSEIGSGVYKVNLAAADVNGTVITLKFAGSGGDNRYVTIVTQA